MRVKINLADQDPGGKLITWILVFPHNIVRIFIVTIDNETTSGMADADVMKNICFQK